MFEKKHLLASLGNCVDVGSTNAARTSRSLALSLTSQAGRFPVFSINRFSAIPSEPPEWVVTLAVKMGRFARFHKLTVMNRDAREMMSALTPTGLDSISLEIAKESDIQESIHSYIGLSQCHFVGAFFEWIAHSA